jgi:hypothetical protein
MNIQRYLKGFAASLVLVSALGIAATAQAGTVTGNLWHLSPDSATYVASPSLVPGTAPDVTFNSSSVLSFDAGFGPTVGAWLSSGGAFNVTENTAGTLASLISDGSNVGTVIDFKGTMRVTSGQTFTITHDDGIYLSINGIDMGFNPNPTPPETETETWGGASGCYPYELVYTENHGGYATLVGDLGSVPDGGTTVALLGMGFAGLAVLRNKFARN